MNAPGTRPQGVAPIRFVVDGHTNGNVRHRANNEDYFATLPAVGLFVVCDGMGGHNAGEVASRTTAVEVRTQVARAFASALLPSEQLALLKHAVRTANAVVYDRAQHDPALHGMGTTCAALLVGSRYALLAHVGDSRIYRLRGAHFEQLTTDHNLAHLGGHGAHVLTRSIGQTADVEVDMRAEPVQVGDIFVLCTDGVALDPVTFVKCLQVPLRRAAFVLVEEAIRRGSTDNCTAVVVRVEAL